MKLLEQKELIKRLREAYKARGLSLNKILDLMPEDERKIGKTTCQRIFNSEDAENKNFDYNTLILLSDLLLTDEGEDARNRMEYKKEVIEMLETKIEDLEDKIEFRTNMIDSLETTMAHLRRQNERLTSIVDKLTERD